MSHLRATMTNMRGAVERSLWLHYAVVGKLVADPEGVLSKARSNLEHLRVVHPTGAITSQFDEWQRLLNGPILELLASITSTEEPAIQLRSNTPFAAVLTEDERTEVLDAFRASWSARTDESRPPQGTPPPARES
jgi:hypothetical protein